MHDCLLQQDSDYLRTQKIYTHVHHPCIHVSTCDWNQIHTINPRVMQALLCLAVSGQAHNSSSYTATSKSSPPHFSPPPLHSLSLVGGLGYHIYFFVQTSPLGRRYRWTSCLSICLFCGSSPQHATSPSYHLD